MSNGLVLITGATGMVGFRVLVFVLRAGYTVRTATRSQESYERIASLAPLAPYLSQLSNVVVPDITVLGAYNEAVKGVTYVIHVASPINEGTSTESYEISVVKPAVRGTLGMLEAAATEPSIKRIVITGSIASLTSNTTHSDASLTEETRDVHITRPLQSTQDAYIMSKYEAFEATNTFMREQKPSFDVITIMPCFVIGRDDTVTDAAQITKGTNGIVMASLLGYPRPALSGIQVHIDDVAEMHLRSLDPKIEGNQNFLASGEDGGVTQWTDSFDIVKKRYPAELEAGIFKFADASVAETLHIPVSNAKAQKVFGIKFKNYEEQVISVIDHYVELVKAKKN
ncbi:hypothetical protein VHEMI01661 [[Torrubiella] hemipterigena]|uniref:NAD-dependent epimerase/dehydratase domain-containing protein n=1 Tax=[Torrubiella] hemipterigena TaxID=1531966 RepID=A0A0A1T861_9HYPO|nr:hypothetical protein VHEMI01661 [[Torrubiella] hemipterigena]